MLTVAIPKRNKLQNIIVLTPKDGSRLPRLWSVWFYKKFCVILNKVLRKLHCIGGG